MDEELQEIIERMESIQNNKPTKHLDVYDLLEMVRTISRDLQLLCEKLQRNGNL